MEARASPHSTFGQIVQAGNVPIAPGIDLGPLVQEEVPVPVKPATHRLALRGDLRPTRWRGSRMRMARSRHRRPHR